MPRRNHRQATRYEPLDLTPPPFTRQPLTDDERRERHELNNERRADRAERQANARMQKAIDWSACVVPGCGESLLAHGVPGMNDQAQRRDPAQNIPICATHAAVVWNGLVQFHTRRREFIHAIADVNEQLAAREKAMRDEAHEELMASNDGDIYFVRLGSLVKVGWTRDLNARLKSYGASAELLVSYPATRTDETNLHRQLRPALAKGREWYEDGDIIAHFVSEALAEYGTPPAFDGLWTEPKRVVAGKRQGGKR